MESDAVLNEMLPLNRIRVETALSRFPIHRLAKKGDICIDLGDQNSEFQWKVGYSKEYGQPGPHAYKVDTLIVNRRIDEAPRPLPEVLRLGSLREINRELGLAEDDTQTFKKALIQNASAFISAKIRYRPKNAKDGRERWREIHYTRYSILFNGDVLPDGRVADAVYIVLNPPHRKMLNEAEVRPLDYEYLTKLSPGPQRLYELLSFQVYGAVASGRARAKLVYSEYCMCAPQIRYTTFNQVKKQMFKLHAPHREAGYITKVEYRETTARDGQPDWEMLYTPGPKATAEYHAFNHRHVRQLSAERKVSQPSASTIKPQEAVQASLDLGNNDLILVAEMTRRGITEKKARELLVNAKADQDLMDQLEYTDFIVQQAPVGKFHNPPGLYIRNIENNVVPPATFETSRQRRLQEEMRRAADSHRAEQAQLEMAYAEYESQAIDELIAAMSPNEYTRVLNDQRRTLKRSYRNMTDSQLEELVHASVRAYIKSINADAITMNFEDFCRDYNRLRQPVAVPYA
jgi:hypothetical protein